MMLSGWGRFPQQDCTVVRPRSEADVRAQLVKAPLIARGNGRSYGDSAQNTTNTLDMRGLNRMLAFEADTGQLVAEAGVMLGDVIDCFLPRGWFPLVTPGTKFVTIGGMVAADVHGKNHHCDGSFGTCIDWLDVLGSDGEVRRCSRSENADIFFWTIGGMGLTGVVLRVAFRLRQVESGWIRQTTLAAPDLDTAMRLFEEHAAATYSVAWIDCLKSGAGLGRSAIMLGEHVPLRELPAKLWQAPYLTPRRKIVNVPISAPTAFLNRLTVKVVNSLYYHHHVRQRGEQLVGWDNYFYPLDALGNWNRIYGRRGLLQFQCALPLASARAGLRELLETVSNAGQGSFLAVLKRLGATESGRFSFPLDGYTLALDFPANRRTFELLDRLDQIVLAHDGRFYLAKDSRMSAATMRQSDRRVPGLIAMRERGCARYFQSSQSERLQL